MKAKVTSKGRVTIPKELRELLGIRPGDVLEVDEEAERVVISKPTAEEQGEGRAHGLA